MYICAWTLNFGENNLPDFWTIHETEAEAQAAYRSVLTNPELHCAAVAKIGTATEPHWLDEVAA